MKNIRNNLLLVLIILVILPAEIKQLILTI